MDFKIIALGRHESEHHENEDSITWRQIIFMQGPDVPCLGIDALFTADSSKPLEFELCSLTSTCESGSTFNSAEFKLIADNLDKICGCVLSQYQYEIDKRRIQSQFFSNLFTRAIS